MNVVERNYTNSQFVIDSDSGGILETSGGGQLLANDCAFHLILMVCLLSRKFNGLGHFFN